MPSAAVLRTATYGFGGIAGNAVTLTGSPVISNTATYGFGGAATPGMR